MTQRERRVELLKCLIDESANYADIGIPEDENTQRKLLRALLNVRPPMPVEQNLLSLQDEYLKHEIDSRGIVSISELPESRDGIYIYEGEITQVSCDAIVNDANSGLCGCYMQNHNCTDNCVHTFAGMQLRAYCAKIIEEQGSEEAPGGIRITPAYNLPSQYVFHTVGPIINSTVNETHEAMLRSCYNACLDSCREHNIHSIAFSCISTDISMFPQKRAAEIAVSTVLRFKERNKTTSPKIVFVVRKKEIADLYRSLLD